MTFILDVCWEVEENEERRKSSIKQIERWLVCARTFINAEKFRIFIVKFSIFLRNTRFVNNHYVANKLQTNENTFWRSNVLEKNIKIIIFFLNLRLKPKIRKNNQKFSKENSEHHVTFKLKKFPLVEKPAFSLISFAVYKRIPSLKSLALHNHQTKKSRQCGSLFYRFFFRELLFCWLRKTDEEKIWKLKRYGGKSLVSGELPRDLINSHVK